MFKQLGIAMAMICFAYAVNAQDCRVELKGIVTDFHDGEPLAFAQLYIKDLQKGTSTNENGEYVLSNLCAGTFDMVITHPECETKTIQIEVQNDKIQNFTLEHHINDLDQVEVVADVHDDHEKTQSSTRVSEETINEFSGATLGDALATVQGVSVLKTGNSVTKPIIHGLFGSRVTIVNNGLRQQDQEWGVEHAPNIDLNTASNIQVIKGASALRYGGDAIGGTIVIDPERYLAKDTLKGQAIAQLQSNGRGGSFTGSVSNYKKSGWYQQATLTYKKLGDFEAPDYVLSNTGSQTYAGNFAIGYHKFEYGASIRYSYYNTELGILRASHLGNSSSLVTSINTGVPSVIRDFTYNVDPPKQDVEHHGLQLDAYRRIQGLGKLELNYAFQFNNRLEFDIRRQAFDGEASLDLDLLTHTLAAFLVIDSMEDTEVELGIDGLYQNNSPNPATGIRRLIPDYESQKIGGFASFNHQLSDQWLFDAGLRYDYYRIDADKFYLQNRWEGLGYDQQFPEFEVREIDNQILTNPVFDYHLFAFSAGAKYLLEEHYDFALNLSTANRAPNPSELFSDGLHHALASIELGQLDLRKEQSYKLNFVAHAVHDNLDVEVNPYLNIVEDYVQLIPNGIETTTRGAFPVYQYEQVSAVLAGVDVGATWDIFKIYSVDPERQFLDPVIEKHLSLNSRFSYIYGQNRTNDEPLINMPPTQFFNELVWTNGILDNLELKISNQSTLKQTRFPDNDYEVEIPDDQGNTRIETVRISESPAGYSLWNVGAGYSFAKAKLNLRVNNVFNTNYRNYLNRQRFYADDIGTDVQLQFIYNF
ncbi:iron complex outermembrane recepter protein [Nonlabens sp. Hel1_33_55]|uniref:TonB-dependent receptor n=1 Tax=Nonlabens sp. Hel1_33_55 TaxID=1336802 RepID=UPI000875D73F|nr:TonB-dependent receptor [Nonlabens sp. Hel1_33_55]SCX91261.1 iron complex outermembrane recepter protein [Nonlabens sp. Hel1_33_55]